MSAAAPHGEVERARVFWLQVAAWAVAVALAWTVLAWIGFRTRDPDSALHIDIVSDLAGRPATDWLIPQWGGHWNREGLYREHPPGLFLLSWPLVALGYPAAQAPLAMNALFQVLSLLLLQQLARIVAPPRDARAVGWLLLFLPIAFVFRIRANHEQLVLCFLLAALVSVEKSRTRPAWMILAALAAVATMAVKGVFVALLFASCAFWLLMRPAPSWRLRLFSWGGLGLMVAVSLGAAAWFDAAYRELSGDSFIGPYLSQQLGLAARQRAGATAAMLEQKFANFAWYGGRILWFSFPWALVVLAPLLPRVRRAWQWNATMSREILLYAGIAVLYVGLLSLSDRRADRYAFPAYYLTGVAGSVALLRCSPVLRRLSDQVARLWPFEQVVVWLMTFLLALPSFWRLIPTFKLINNY